MNNTEKAETDLGTAPRFEYRIERMGRQTTHYITSKDMIAYFVRRPGQTEEQMRERGEWIAAKLNA